MSPPPFGRASAKTEFDGGVILIAAARKRMRARRVEPSLANEGLVDMEGDDLAEVR